MSELFEFINIRMFNYQIGRLRSVCESGGEFSGKSILLAIYSECTPIIGAIVLYLQMFHE